MTTTQKKKILLKDLMAAMEERLGDIVPILMAVLRAEDIGLNVEEDAPEQTIANMRRRLNECLAEPSDDKEIMQQIESASEFLKEYE